MIEMTYDANNREDTTTNTTTTNEQKNYDEINLTLINCTNNLSAVQNDETSITDNQNEFTHEEFMKNSTKTNKLKNSLKNCNIICCFIFGILLIILSIITFHHTLFDIFMEERLRMTPGFPPFEWWVKPQPEIFARTYIFTATNSEAFLNGTDKKLKLKEFGPIVYKEFSIHKDIVFHQNSTMSYTIERHVEFVSEKNPEGILNQTIIVPNIVLLGMAAYLQDYMMSIKMAFNFISKNDPLFINTTVYNYLWNLTTPALDSIKNYVPFMIPQDNGGALYNVYRSFSDRVNVRIGQKYGGKEFFMINTFNGRPTVPGFYPERGDCFADIQNATEGALYRNYVTKNTILYFWRKTVCRVVPLYFEKEVKIGPMVAYKFVAKTSLYDRLKNQSLDCYDGFNENKLPNGLSDVSKCYDNLPVAVSLPHFWGTDGYWNDRLEGFHPSKDKHGSYSILEPITGVPMEQIARSQSNLILPNFTLFNTDVKKFSGMVIPIFWLEYHQESLTVPIYALLAFTVNILPWFQYIISTCFLIGGIIYAIVAYMKYKSIHSFQQLYYKLLLKNQINKKNQNQNNISAVSK